MKYAYEYKNNLQYTAIRKSQYTVALLRIVAYNLGRCLLAYSYSYSYKYVLCGSGQVLYHVFLRKRRENHEILLHYFINQVYRLQRFVGKYNRVKCKSII